MTLGLNWKWKIETRRADVQYWRHTNYICLFRWGAGFATCTTLKRKPFDIPVICIMWSLFNNFTFCLLNIFHMCFFDYERESLHNQTRCDSRRRRSEVAVPVTLLGWCWHLDEEFVYLWHWNSANKNINRSWTSCLFRYIVMSVQFFPFDQLKLVKTHV